MEKDELNDEHKRQLRASSALVAIPPPPVRDIRFVFLPLPLQGQAARQQKGPGLNYDENIVQLLMKSGQNNPPLLLHDTKKGQACFMRSLSVSIMKVLTDVSCAAAT